jgi:hypothetical protein
MARRSSRIPKLVAVQPPSEEASTVMKINGISISMN